MNIYLKRIKRWIFTTEKGDLNMWIKNITKYNLFFEFIRQIWQTFKYSATVFARKILCRFLTQKCTFLKLFTKDYGPAEMLFSIIKKNIVAQSISEVRKFKNVYISCYKIDVIITQLVLSLKWKICIDQYSTAMVLIQLVWWKRFPQCTSF